MTDPISDMLTRIRNAYMAGHKKITMPCSKIKEQIAKVLEKEEYLETVKTVKNDNKKTLEIELKYKGKLPAIDNIKRISKPGRRTYIAADKILQTLSGYGLTILSTNEGILTDTQAKKKKIGGEVICQVW